MATTMVLDSIEQAIWTRAQEGVLELTDVVHHSDRGSQGGFNWSSQHLDPVEVFRSGDEGLGREDERCARGGASAVACGSGLASADAVAWAA